MGKKHDDDLSLDFSGVRQFFRSNKTLRAVRTEHVAMWAFILAALLLVLWIRMLPASLPLADDWAQESIRSNIRGQFAQEIGRQFPNLPQENRDALVEERLEEYLAQNEATLAPVREQLAEQMRAGFQYTGPDGQQYTYLGDLDSYFWLRYTRNHLETGMTCDEVVDGECRDTYILAPVGGGSSFNPSLHVFAIGWVYQFMTLFNEGYPLPAASYLVPVIIGLLGVIPAFFIGRKLAGNVGGFFAAVLIAINPLVLSRSIGSDNDAWNVTLPLFIMWMAVEAVEAQDFRRSAIYASLAGLFVGIHAATWAGWWFIYLIVLLSMIAYLGFAALRSGIAARSAKIWADRGVQAAALALAAFYVAGFVFTLLAGVTAGQYARTPTQMFAASANLDRAIGNEYWPNVLTTVAELNKASFQQAVGTMGGPLLFFAALIGLLLMILPRKNWGWQQYGTLALGALIFIYLLNTDSLGKYQTLALLALPIALAVVAAMLTSRGSEGMHIAAALIVLTWFLATVYTSYSGVRFILLMVPAFGIAFAVAEGRVYEWASGYLSKELPWHRYATNTLVFAVLALSLIQPIRAGHGTAEGFVPTIDDAWWDSLTRIREESAPDAIINSWWDFGHWFKYVADRRVSADGTTQHTHVPHWLGLALVTTDEEKAVGTLRMLDCGSDAFPGIEGEHGAYGKALAAVSDPIRAHDIVENITVLDRDEAHAYLQEQGLSAAQADDVLASSHCAPPENYFITSGDMVGKAGVWAHFGLWDFRRAYVVQHARDPNTSREAAIQDFVERLGYTRQEAEQLYFDARALSNEGEINAFAAPWPGYITHNWVQCQRQNASILCPVGLGIGQQGAAAVSIDGFIYNLTAPQNSTLVFGARQNGQLVSQQLGTPAVLLIAGDELQTVTFDNATAGLGVLIDVEQNRLLLADPQLIGSMFTQLYYLDGRYNEHFEKFDDRIGVTGTRVVVWKVDWDGTQ